MVADKKSKAAAKKVNVVFVNFTLVNIVLFIS